MKQIIPSIIVLFLICQSCTVDKLTENRKLNVYDEKIENFILQDEGLHYAIYAVPACDLQKIRKIKSAFTNYHNTDPSLAKLKIGNLYLNVEEKTQLILIRSFENKSDVLDYVDKFNSLDEFQYDMYAVTQHNYREIVMQKSTKNYEAFYELHYIQK